MLLLIASVLSCSNPATDPHPGPNGVWILATIDGTSLPVSIGEGAEIVGGQINVLSDGTYWSQTRAVINGAEFKDLFEGRWSLAGDGLELRQTAPPRTLTVRWNGDTLEIPNGRLLVYGRPGPAKSF